MLLQASFIQSGFLLTILPCHDTMDINDQVQMVRMLSKACRGGIFTDEEMKDGNMNRRNLIPLLSEGDEAQLDSPVTATVPSTTQPTPTESMPDAPPDLIWASFRVNSISQAAMKAEATSTQSQHESVSSTPTFISTDDTLSALVWQAVARARLVRLSPSNPITFV